MSKILSYNNKTTKTSSEDWIAVEATTTFAKSKTRTADCRATLAQPFQAHLRNSTS